MKSEKSDQHASKESDLNLSGRGDLFSEESVQEVAPKEKPLHQTEQFVWTLNWLHIPGGGLFGIIFAIVAVRAFWEMYGTRKNYAQH